MEAVVPYMLTLDTKHLLLRLDLRGAVGSPLCFEHSPKYLPGTPSIFKDLCIDSRIFVTLAALPGCSRSTGQQTRGVLLQQWDDVLYSATVFILLLFIGIFTLTVVPLPLADRN